MEREKSVRVLIAIPTGGSPRATFGLDLVGLMLTTLEYGMEDGSPIEVSIAWENQDILSNSRQFLARDSVMGNYTHLLFIDDDMRFPVHTLHSLLAHKKPVVAANCPVKQFPSPPTARVLKDGKLVPLWLEEKDDRLVQVNRIGCGIMLIDTRVFELIPTDNLFDISYAPLDDVQMRGEDWNFIHLLEKIGVPVFVDQELSHDIGHSGEFTYTNSYADGGIFHLLGVKENDGT